MSDLLLAIGDWEAKVRASDNAYYLKLVLLELVQILVSVDQKLSSVVLETNNLPVKDN